MTVAAAAFPGAWIRAVSTVVAEVEIGPVLGLTILSLTHTARCAVGIIGLLTSRSNTSVKRTRTGGADLLVFFWSRTPVRAAYLGLQGLPPKSSNRAP